MKTRLLKKLRREASTKYWVSKAGSHNYNVCYSGDGIIVHKIFPYKTLDDAKCFCDELRREYIANRISSMKNDTTNNIVY